MNKSLRKLGLAALLAAVCGAAAGCVYSSDTPDIEGRDVRLTILHTSDIHSRILPYDYVPMFTETKLGLAEGRGPYGGIARIADVVKRERGKAGRSLWLDSGDLFEGAPIFNYFHGEPEVRAASLAGLDAMALGNHEFDLGAANVVEQFTKWAGFPLLAANYDFQEGAHDFVDEFESLIDPMVVFNLDGLKVGVIGMGNTSSMTSIQEADNSLGVRPYNAVQILQDYVDLIRGSVDVVVVLSHLGLTSDQYVARNICGVDIILGGHHHIALNPPMEIPFDPDEDVIAGAAEGGDYDLSAESDLETVKNAICPVARRRNVILAHPNAFAKFVFRLDLVVRDGRIRSHTHEIFPIDNTVAEDPDVADLLDPYVRELNTVYDLDRVVAQATTDIARFGTTGGDSALGNLVCEAMQRREYVQTDFCVTNSLGLRTDVLTGDVTVETLFNVMPFENTITKMVLSGIEVQDLLDYASARSAGRGCAAQIQVSGIRFDMNCRTGAAENVRFHCTDDPDTGEEEGCEPLEPHLFYELATNNYMAWGGSGFEMLKINTTKEDTGISIREAVASYLLDHPAIPECTQTDAAGACTAGIGIEDGRIRPTYN
jgi:5'-nucleotidase / UDP-sugar diphosphatase